MKFNAKVQLLATFFLAAFAIVVLKLFFIQVVSAEKLAAAAEDQHFYSLEIPARRGEIRTLDGFTLAANKNNYLFYANLSQLTDNKELVTDKIAQILVRNVPEIATESATLDKLKGSLLTKFSVKNAIWVNLVHFVDRQTKEEIEKLNIVGLGFIDEQSRDYPEGSMSAHLLGFVGFDAVGNPKGYFGLEGFYERELAGKNGEVRVEKDAFGRPIAIGSETRRDQQNGRNLIITINRAVQQFTEKHLQDGIKDWKAAGGTAIVMDPTNGAIISMASSPRYDLRNFSYYPTEWYKNPAIANLYEPGSIMKPLVMAAAINEEKVDPEMRCDKCDGPRKIGEYSIHTFNDKYHPNLTMTETLINSDNTGMVFVGEKLGFDRLYSYATKLGFSQKSGVDLQEEEGGSLRSEKDYYPIDQATFTFGQGISLNAIQVMRAWTVLANNGYLVTPHVVAKIEDNGKVINPSWSKGAQVISSQTAKTITEMLVRVAKESPVHFPLDQQPALAKFRIAAKSGTAQIALGGKYREQGTIASVIGYFPADNPKFLVMVKLNEPEVRVWGSDTAGPVFAKIVRDLVYYYGLTP